MAMGTRTPGPRHLFVRFRGSSSVFYLGTCVAAPKPEHTKSRIPIMNDLAGRSEPFQIVKDGENAVILATMNRFDYPLLQTVRGLDSSNTPPATPLAGNLAAGSEAGFTRGTFVIGYTDLSLFLFSDYADTPGASGDVTDQAPVRLYQSAELVKYLEDTEGTRVLEVACAFRCTSVYHKTNLNFAGSGGGLYTENPALLGTTVAALRALIAVAGN